MQGKNKDASLYHKTGVLGRILTRAKFCSPKSHWTEMGALLHENVDLYGFGKSPLTFYGLTLATELV